MIIDSVYEEEEKKKGKNRMKLTLDPLLSWGTKVIHEKNGKTKIDLPLTLKKDFRSLFVSR